MNLTVTRQPVTESSWLTETFDHLENTICENLDIFIAGGSVRKAMLGQPLGKSDIDIFFKNFSDITTVSSKFEKEGLVTTHCANCKAINVEKDALGIKLEHGMEKVNIQLITHKEYSSIPSLLSNFDFSVCQFAYSKGYFYYTDAALAHEQSKTLSVVNKQTHEAMTGRMFKYMALGYSPDLQLFEHYFLQSGGSGYISPSALSSGGNYAMFG